MPTISIFFGIIVQMYWNDHAPPHIHAWYQGNEALISIEIGDLLQGGMSRKALRLLREWIGEHRQELLDNWQRGENLEPFYQIPGADD